MSIRRIPFMALAVILYFIVAWAAGVSLSSSPFAIPLPSGASLSLTVGELLILAAAILGFFELVGSSSGTSTAILSHGLQLIVFLIALLLFLLVARFGTGTFLVIMIMTLINTVAGYSISILRARRDFSIERTME